MSKKPSKNGNGKKTPNRKNKDKQKEKSPQTDSKTPAYLLEPTEPITDNASVSRYVISYSNPETPEYLNRDLNNDDMVSGPLKKLITYGEKNPAFTAFLFTLLSTVVLAVIRFVFFLAQAGYLQYFGLNASFVNVAEKSIVYYVVMAVAATFAMLAFAEILSHFHVAFKMIIAFLVLFIALCSLSYKQGLATNWIIIIVSSFILSLLTCGFVFFIVWLESILLNLAISKINTKFRSQGKALLSQGYVKIALVMLLIVSPIFILYFLGYLYASDLSSISSINDNLLIITENEKYYICEPFFIIDKKAQLAGSLNTPVTTLTTTSSSIVLSSTDTNATTQMNATSTNTQSSGTGLSSTSSIVTSVPRKSNTYIVKDIQIYVPKENVHVTKRISSIPHDTLEYKQLTIEEKEYIDGIIQENQKEEKQEEE